MASTGAPLRDELGEYYSLNERVYRKLAPFYDLVLSPFKRLRREAARAAAASPRSRVLDVATGTGEQALAFAALGHDVVGLDISKPMLRRARRKARAGRPLFQQGDAAHLPFADAEFDVASVSLVLHEMPPEIREQTLREMARVTKPEGKLLIVDYALPKSRMARAIVYRAVKVYERERYGEFIRLDLRALLQRLGIRVEREQAALLGIVRIVVATKDGSELLH